MARNTLEAVFGALGAGLTGFGRERQQRQEDEQRRRREADLMRVQMLNMGFDPEAEATRRSQGLAQAGRIAQAAPATPFMPATSALGQALSQASQDLPRGRSITVGGERFVQPLSRMPETLAQRQAEQAEARDIRAEERAARTLERQEEVRRKNRAPERDQLVYDPTRGAIVNVTTGRVVVPEGLPARPTTSSTTAATPRAPTIPTQDVDFLRQFAPSREVVNGRERFTRPATPLNSIGVQLATRDATNPAAGANEQRYLAIASAIAADKAQRTFTGVLSNQDIKLFRDQVVIRPGDNIATQADKFRRLLEWAEEGTNETEANSAAGRLRAGRYD